MAEASTATLKATSKKHQPERITTTAHPLLAALDELNACWKQAEADFAAMMVPVTISCEGSKRWLQDHPDADDAIGEVTEFLEWTRHENQWRICWVERTAYYDRRYSDTEKKPIAECPMEVRVEMASKLRKLRKKMIEARETYLPEVREAVAAIKQALAD